MAPPEQFDRAADVGVDAGLAVVVLDASSRQLSAQARRAVDPAVDGEVLHLGIGAKMIDAEPRTPALAEAVVQVREHARRVPVGTAAGGLQVDRAPQPDRRAVLVARQSAHAGRRMRAHAAVQQARRQHGVRAQVDLGSAVEQAGLLVRAFIEEAAVGHDPDDAAAHAAAVVQRSAQVDFGAIVVPTAGAEFSAEGELPLPPLAHQVDGGRGIAGAVQQAVGAAQDLDALVDGHVFRRGGAVAHHGRHAVLLEGFDLEAARVVAGGEVMVRLHRDAGGVPHDVVQGVQVLLADLFLADHGDRLGRLAHAQGQLAQRRLLRGAGLALAAGVLLLDGTANNSV